MYDADDESGPPPAPELADLHASNPTPAPEPVAAPVAAPVATPATPPRRPRPRARLLPAVIVSLAVGFVAGSVTADRVTLPDLPWREAVVQSERDLLLVGLLEDIVASERIMLSFNDDVAEGLDGASDEDVALAAIAAAAADGEEGLRAARPGLLRSAGDRVVDDVRDAYVPHLDSWIEYLAAVAERPGLLFLRNEQQPYLLRINATAEAFADALETLIATDPAGPVVELAERILDDGFRTEREADI
jgi:hypothetical protein